MKGVCENGNSSMRDLVPILSTLQLSLVVKGVLAVLRWLREAKSQMEVCLVPN